LIRIQVPQEKRMSDHAQWVARPIFISSTFKDMHAERDHLRHTVFPALQERLRERRQHLEPVDLRLGVETVEVAGEEAKELLVLKVCLDEVRRSRPFLLVLLGDRYGWVPPEERMAAAAREAGFATSVAGKSVTALEIEFGILREDPSQRRRAFFYFRAPLPYADMPPAVAAQYSDAHSPDPTVRDRHARLEALKAGLATDPELGSCVRHYAAAWDPALRRVTGLEEWGRQVLDDLWAELDEETARFSAQPNPLAEDLERQVLAAFVERGTRDYVGRVEVSDRLLALVRSPVTDVGRWGVCVTGAPGTGKSALFAHLDRRLVTDPAVLVLAHAAGISEQSARVDSMLRRWVQELAAHLHESSPLEEDATAEDVETVFAELLSRAAGSTRVVVLVDALNQFEPGGRGRLSTWLPRPWPANARLIATAVPGAESEALAARPGVRLDALDPLGLDESRQLAVAVGLRHHRRFHPQILDAILSRRLDQAPAAGNPLWLTLAMEQLNLLDADDFARVDQEFAGTPEERLHQLLLDVARRLPADVEGLYEWLLGQTEKVFGEPVARGFADLIALSRFGWRESDLRAMVPVATRLLFPVRPADDWDDLKLATLRRGFRAHLVRRGGAGQWDFFHAQARRAVGRRNLADPALVRRLHAVIADHLEGLPADDPLRRTELMYHLTLSGDAGRAARHYAGVSDLSPALSAATDALAGCVAEQPGLAAEVAAWVGLPDLDRETRLELAVRLGSHLSRSLIGRVPNRQRLTLLETIGPVFEQALAADPHKRYRHERYLSAWLKELADLAGMEGRPDRAREYLRRSLELAERAAADAANPAALRSDPSEWKRKLDRPEPNLDDPGELQEELRRGYEQGEEMMANVLHRLDHPRDPADPGAEEDAWLDRLPPEEREQFRAQMSFYMAQATRPKRFADLLMVARRHLDLAVMDFRQRRLDEAEANYRKALDMALEGEQHYRTRREAQHVQFRARVGLGDVARAGGRFDEARDRYRDAQALAQGLIDEGVEERLGRGHLALTWTRMACLDLDTGHRADAGTAYRRAVEQYRRLAEEEPGDYEARVDLAGCLADLGTFERSQGEPARVRELYQESLGLYRQIVAELPHHVGARVQLGHLIDNLGFFELEESRPGPACVYFGERLEMARKLAAEQSDDLPLQRELALALIILGDAEVQADQPEAARGRYEEARGVILRLAPALPPEVVEYDLDEIDRRMEGSAGEPSAPTEAGSREERWQEAKRHRDLAETHLKAGDRAAAGQSLRQAFALLSPLGEDWPENAAVQDDIASVCDILALLSLSERRMEDARAFSERAITVRERLAEILPPDERRELRMSYVKQGVLWLLAGRPADARRLFTRELAISERLARESPADLRAQQDWATALLEQGNLSLYEGDWPGAEKWFQECLAIRDRLAQAQPNHFLALREWAVVVARLEWSSDRGNGAGELDRAGRGHLVECDRLAREQPRELLHLRGPLVGLSLIAQDCFWAGDPADARRIYLLVMAILERVDRILPDLPEVQQEWSAALARLAAVALRQGERETARRFLVTWLDLCRQWGGLSPEDAEANQLWAAALALINTLRDGSRGGVLEDQIRRMQADLSQWLAAAAPDDPFPAREAGFHLQLLATSESASPLARVDWVRQVIDRYEQMRQRQPIDSLTGHALVHAYNHLADLYLDMGQEAEWRAERARGTELLREMKTAGIDLTPYMEALLEDAGTASPPAGAPRPVQPVVSVVLAILLGLGLMVAGVLSSWQWSWGWLVGIPFALLGLFVIVMVAVVVSGLIRVVPCPRCGNPAAQFRGGELYCRKCG
jgi:tetratricopeptide (TPR) repeat protein